MGGGPVGDVFSFHIRNLVVVVVMNLRSIVTFKSPG